MPRWGPAKPKTPMKVVECGLRTWDDHGLDIPHEIETIDFKVTGTGHFRIEQIHLDCCQDRAALNLLDDKQPDHRIGGWLSRHACSFVMFETRAIYQVGPHARDPPIWAPACVTDQPTSLGAQNA